MTKSEIAVRDLLRLFSIPRIGPQKIRALIAHFSTPDAVLHASAQELIRIPGIEKKIAAHILHHTDDERFADEQLRTAEKNGIRIITLWDNEYPELLKKIYDPPLLLFVSGKLQEADRRSLGIVGTRHPSSYGQAMTEEFTRGFVQRSICVVSGLARGIDTIAHTTALKARGRTIAVTGSGLDVPYPPENRKLMELIADFGAVISEFPMGTNPDAANFPRRNRIISGMSLGTLVIESAEDGGAMITATTALDQDREVFAVPGVITEKRSAGPNALIQEGRAKLVTSVADVLAELQVQIPLSFEESKAAPMPPLSTPERNLFDIIATQPLHIDAIADTAGIPTSDALVLLLSLEFKNLVRQMPGKYFIRA